MIGWILAVPLAGWCACTPILPHDNPSEEKEFGNVYQALCSPVISSGIAQNFAVTGSLTVNGRTYQPVSVSTAVITASTATTIGNQFIPTGLSVTITPTTTHDVIESSVVSTMRTSNCGLISAATAIFKGSQNLCDGSAADVCSMFNCNAGADIFDSSVGYSITSCAGTTSPVTYTTRMYGVGGAGTITFAIQGFGAMTVKDLGPNTTLCP